jgi:hypothetical protein
MTQKSITNTYIVWTNDAQKRICQYETPAAYKVKMSQLELSIKQEIVYFFVYLSNQFMYSSLRHQLSSPAKRQLIIYL